MTQFCQQSFDDLPNFGKSVSPQYKSRQLFRLRNTFGAPSSLIQGIVHVFVFVLFLFVSFLLPMDLFFFRMILLFPPPPTQNCLAGVWPSGTTYVELDNVKVPAANLIGKENEGFKARQCPTVLSLVSLEDGCG